MPRKIAKDGDKPRRRGAHAAAMDDDGERGLTLRILFHSPKDTVAGLLVFAAVSAIVANALFLQTGHHPAPMFGTVVTLPAPALAATSPLPRPRPAEAGASVPESRPAMELKSALEPRPVLEPKTAEPKAADPLTNLVKATSGPEAPTNALRPPASIPVASHAEGPASAAARRVAAVQRALTQYGYGQLKPTGTMGPDTLAAIQKFERARKIPVTGQISERLVHELAATIGHPVE